MPVNVFKRYMNAGAHNNLPAQQTPFFQAKLSVNQPGDVYEQEADAVADKVIRMENAAASPSFFSPVSIQRKCKECEEEEKNALRKEGDDAIGSPVQTENYLSSIPGGKPLEKEDRTFFESRMGYDFSGVRVHNDTAAGQSAKNINALAYTNGSNIVFGEGQYQPNTENGKRLLAHELTHVVQQKDNSTIQREVINMEPLTVSVGMPSDLSALSTPVPADEMSASVDTAHIELNSQLPATALPYTPGGWNGNDIAGKLGQYDRIPGTDSDAVRCVQAVGLMSHILMGPAAAISYLQAMSLQGTLGGLTPRKRTALRVLEHVQYQIENRRGTYGEMYWAMEALHDMFYTDSEGTPASTPDTVRDQITPAFDMSQNMTNMDVWCNNSTELLAQASTLQPGEQFMLNTWNISFNSVFDEAGVPTTQQRLRYTQTDERDRPLRTVSIQRIDTTLGKPAASQIDMNRDRKHGHQMLIFKDPADSHIKMYEPELTVTGNHLFDLTADATVINSMLFHDQPAFELFAYVQLWGKISPARTTSFTAP